MEADHKAVFEVLTEGLDEDEFMLELIDAGAEDIEIEDDRFVVTAEKEDFGSIQSKLEEMGITPEEANLERIPTTYKKIDEETQEQLFKLIDVIVYVFVYKSIYSLMYGLVSLIIMY